MFINEFDSLQVVSSDNFTYRYISYSLWTVNCANTEIGFFRGFQTSLQLHPFGQEQQSSPTLFDTKSKAPLPVPRYIANVSGGIGQSCKAEAKGASFFRMEDFRPPSLKRFFTDEPTSGSLANVKKTRALFLSKTLDEKAQEARWYKQDIVDLSEVLTWPEYADDMGLESPEPKKPLSAPAPDLNNRVSLWQGDITKLDVDVIVNAANRSLLGGGGVDGAIHRAAGSNLLQECKTLAGCETGDAKMSAGYLLPSRYVLHTVGPIVHGTTASLNHREDLTSCYATCLQRIAEHNKRNRANMEAKRRRPAAGKGEPDARSDAATNSNKGRDSDEGEEEGTSANGRQGTEEKGGSDILKSLRHDVDLAEPLIRSIAFPCISTGVYGYPQEDACRVALATIKIWLEDHPNELDRIVFCVYLNNDLRIYERNLPDFFPLDGASSSARNDDDDET